MISSIYALFNRFRGKNVSVNDLDMNNIPRHVAIVMDGNRRWAQKRGLSRSAGHRAGVEAIRNILTTSKELGIEVLTLFAFSTENWKRPKDEVDGLMGLLVEYLKKETKELNESNVKLKIIGDIGKLPMHIQQEIHNSTDITKDNNGIILNLAINYGGRAEILNAVKGIINDVSQGRINEHQINEKLFSKYLYTAGLPDPDLIIRPSGEYRISNFLLYQMAYSELWFSTVMWPDFSNKVLIRAIKDYQKRNRRFGAV